MTRLHCRRPNGAVAEVHKLLYEVDWRLDFLIIWTDRPQCKHLPHIQSSGRSCSTRVLMSLFKSIYDEEGSKQENDNEEFGRIVFQLMP